MKKRTKWIIGIVVVLAIVVIGLQTLPSKGEKTQQMLETARVTRGLLENGVTATGTVEPIVLVEIGTQVSGVIDKIYVDFNSEVKKGQVLAELDKQNLESELTTSKATLSLRETELAFQEKNYKRQKELWEKQAISATVWEQAEYDYQTAKLSLVQAKANVDKAKTNLDYATITSSIDGVVISRAVEQGQTVAASFSTPTLFKIANDLTKMRVIADVDEADIGNVKEGQTVRFTVDAYPDDEFMGTVDQVRLEATNTSNVITYQVVIDAPNPDLKLKPGLTATVNILTVERENALLIPIKATRFSPDNFPKQLGIVIDKSSSAPAVLDDNTKTVWLKTGNSIKQTVVKTGLNNGISIEVLSGLKENDEVALSIQTIVLQQEVEEASGSPFMPKRPKGGGGPPPGR